MRIIAKKNNSIFLGQSVKYPGNLLYESLERVPEKKKLELPIFEDAQMGMSIGLALNGFLPISCYPRFDFFLLAFNQLINHLDKIKKITDKEFDPFVITRVLVGSKSPIDGGPQHTQNYSKEIKKMLKFISVIELKKSEDIIKVYNKVLNLKKSVVIIEYSSNY